MKTTAFLSTLLIALVLAFTACKKDKDTTPTTKQDTVVQAQDSTTTTEDSETTKDSTTTTTGTTSFDKSLVVGTWKTDDYVVCDNNTSETHVLDANGNGSVKCNGVDGDVTYKYSVSDDGKTIKMGVGTSTILELSQTTFKIEDEYGIVTFTRVK